MNIPFRAIVFLAASTGLATALLNQFVGGWYATRRDRFEREHERELQRTELAHARDMQQDAAHAAAREEFVADAADVAEWITFQWGSEHGLDVDYVIDNEPQPRLDSPTEVIAALRRIAYQHPTRQVRKVAGDLDSAIAGHYGSIVYSWNEAARLDVPQLGGTPSDRQFRKWHDMAESLIEALHTPPSLMAAPVDGA